MKLSKFAMIVAILLGGSGLLISCTSSGPTLVSESSPSGKRLSHKSPGWCTDEVLKEIVDSEDPPSAPKKGKAPSTGKLSKVEYAECKDFLVSQP
jgi:hypothetical protein